MRIWLMLLFLCLTICCKPCAEAAPAEPVVVAPYEWPDFVIVGPIWTLDPCGSADIEFGLTDVEHAELQCGSATCTSRLTYGLTIDTDTIAYLITDYHRVSVGDDNYVAMEDTFIVPGSPSLTLFGRSSNMDGGIFGARGTLLGGMDSSGNKFELVGTYLFSDYLGNYSVCFRFD
jgi:hypothetical protein